MPGKALQLRSGLEALPGRLSEVRIDSERVEACLSSQSRTDRSR